jgi:hypothetical protein
MRFVPVSVNSGKGTAHRGIDGASFLVSSQLEKFQLLVEIALQFSFGGTIHCPFFDEFQILVVSKLGVLLEALPKPLGFLAEMSSLSWSAAMDRAAINSTALSSKSSGHL